MRSWISAVLVLLGVAGCRDGDGTEPGNGRVFVQSDPPGARIAVDGRGTGRFTPDTIGGLGGQHEIIVTLDSLGVSYRYGAQVNVDEDSVPSIDGPVVLRCGTPSCYSGLRRYHSFGNIRFAVNPIGALFLEDGIGDGILWPQTTRNSYASQGMPMFAARMRGDSVALGIYDIGYLAGRPAPSPLQPPERVFVEQAPWIIPPGNLIALATIRGLRIEQRLVASATVPDALAIRLVFHNISNDPLYQVTDPLIPPPGVVFEHAFIGFGLDADIGNSSDDMLAYAPASAMVFAYDAGWDEPGFEGAARSAPGLIGLTVLEAPTGAAVRLNGWQNISGVSPDWGAGRVNEYVGLRMMSNVQPYPPSHADPRIGHVPQGPGDVRLLVSVGPLVLLPGDSATVTLAVVLAEPVPGTFEPGTVTPPGEPLDPTRAIAAVAAALFERASAARALLPLLNEQ
jgi:hypothetical protein